MGTLWKTKTKLNWERGPSPLTSSFKTLYREAPPWSVMYKQTMKQGFSSSQSTFQATLQHVSPKHTLPWCGYTGNKLRFGCRWELSVELHLLSLVLKPLWCLRVWNAALICTGICGDCNLQEKAWGANLCWVLSLLPWRNDFWELRHKVSDGLQLLREQQKSSSISRPTPALVPSFPGCAALWNWRNSLIWLLRDGPGFGLLVNALWVYNR